MSGGFSLRIQFLNGMLGADNWFSSVICGNVKRCVSMMLGGEILSSFVTLSQNDFLSCQNAFFLRIVVSILTYVLQELLWEAYGCVHSLPRSLVEWLLVSFSLGLFILRVWFERWNTDQWSLSFFFLTCILMCFSDVQGRLNGEHGVTFFVVYAVIWEGK